MDIKGLFWKGDGTEDASEAEEPVHQQSESSVTSTPVSRPVLRRPVLSALNSGPTATIFQRTTGLQVNEANASTQVSQVVDQEFDAVIMEALEADSREPGFKEFQAQVLALSGIIPDEKKCVAGALVSVQTSNPKLNATQIARAIGERLTLLNGYESAYTAESRQGEVSENKSKQTAITDAEERIRELDSEIARITSERSNLVSQAQKLQSELSGVTHKYDQYRQRFSATVGARCAQLKQQLKQVAPDAEKRGN